MLIDGVLWMTMDAPSCLFSASCATRELIISHATNLCNFATPIQCKK